MEQIVSLANGRCDQENVIEQLKNGVNAMRMPVNDLVSNWAYMVMAALAWNLKAWYGLLVRIGSGAWNWWEWNFGAPARDHTIARADHPGRTPDSVSSPGLQWVVERLLCDMATAAEAGVRVKLFTICDSKNCLRACFKNGFILLPGA